MASGPPMLTPMVEPSGAALATVVGAGVAAGAGLVLDHEGAVRILLACKPLPRSSRATMSGVEPGPNGTMIMHRLWRPFLRGGGQGDGRQHQQSRAIRYSMGFILALISDLLLKGRGQRPGRDRRRRFPACLCSFSTRNIRDWRSCRQAKDARRCRRPGPSRNSRRRRAPPTGLHGVIDAQRPATSRLSSAGGTSMR